MKELIFTRVEKQVKNNEISYKKYETNELTKKDLQYSSRNFVKQNIMKIQTNLTKTLNYDLFRIASKPGKNKHMRKNIYQQQKSDMVDFNNSSKFQDYDSNQCVNNKIHITEFKADIFPPRTQRSQQKQRKIQTKHSNRKSVRNLVRNLGQFTIDKSYRKIKHKTCCDQQQQGQLNKAKIEIKNLFDSTSNLNYPMYKKLSKKQQTTFSSTKQLKKQNIFKVTGLKAPITQITDHYKIKKLCHKVDFNFNNQRIKKSMTLSGLKFYQKIL